MSRVADRFARALDAHQAGHLAEAEAGYRAVLAALPRETHALYLLGVLYLQQDRATEALAPLSAAARYAPAVADIQVALARALAATGQAETAFAHYGAAVRLGATGVEVLGDIAAVLKQLGRAADAVALCRTALALAPGHAGLQNNLGAALDQAGDPAAARTAYRRALRLRPDDLTIGHNLAAALAAAGDRPAAARLCRHLAVLAPGLADIWNNLGLAVQPDDPAAAAGHYRRAWLLAPDQAGLLNNLANALAAQGHSAAALAGYQQALVLAPGDGALWFHLGQSLHDQGRLPAALTAYHRAAAAEPDLTAALYNQAAALAEAGQAAAALLLLRRAEAQQPVVVEDRCRQAVAPTLLVMMAPARANMPLKLLLNGDNQHRLLTWAFPGMAARPLPAPVDVVFNAIADADAGAGYLAAAAALADSLGRPVLNPPARVAASARHRIADAARDCDRLRVPRCLRFRRADAPDPAALLTAWGGALVVRPAGSHGGEAMARLTGPDAWRDYFAGRDAAGSAAGTGDDAYYASEFIDTRNPADGLYRKFRVICVAGRPYPYHLAIGSAWKLHYVTADRMAESWAQQQELAFLQAPAAVLGPAWQQLPAFASALGLDYFGLDCALDDNGRLVVFEANATMLVHVPAGASAPRRAAALAIARALDDLVRQAAGGVTMAATGQSAGTGNGAGTWTQAI